MTKKKLAIVAIVLGVLVSLIGVASATVLRPSGSVTARMDAPNASLIVVDPGVLPLVADTVKVRAEASDSAAPIVITLAPAGDVKAWVGESAFQNVTGLESWSKLQSKKVDGAATAPNPAAAELWRHQFTGKGTLEVQISSTGKMAMLIATDGKGPAPKISLSWPQAAGTLLLIPLLVVGGLILVGGIALLSYAKAEGEPSGKTEGGEVDPDAETQEFEIPKGPLTRRQLRELERRRRKSDPRHREGGALETSAGAAGAGIVPGVVDPERFRALRYVALDDSFKSLTGAAGDTPAPQDSARPQLSVPGAAVLPQRTTFTAPLITAPLEAPVPTPSAAFAPGKPEGPAAAEPYASAPTVGGAGVPLAAGEPAAGAPSAETSSPPSAAPAAAEAGPSGQPSWRALWGYKGGEEK